MIGEPYEKDDIFILENHLTTHGRTSYDPNANRKIGILLGTMIGRKD